MRLANRDLTTFRKVTGFATERVDDFALQRGAMDIAGGILKKNEQAKLVETTSQMQLDLNAYNKQYRIDNEEDPEANSLEYKEGRDKIFQEHKEGVNYLQGRQFDEITRDLTSKDDLSQQAWATKQNLTNTGTSLRRASDNMLKQAYFDGQNLTSGDVVSFLGNMDTAANTLAAIGDGIVGDAQIENINESFRADYIKSALSGMSENNPDGARKFLSNSKDNLTLSDYKTLESIINRNEKSLELKNTERQTIGLNGANVIANNEELSVAQRILAINQAELNGDLLPKHATAARRMLKSLDSFDAVTDVDIMGGFIEQIYDLAGESPKQDSKAYLRAIQSIGGNISTARERGELNSKDATKLNNSLIGMTQSDVTKATKEISLKPFMQSSTKLVKSALPLELRGTAIRDIFFEIEAVEENTGTDISEKKAMEVTRKVINDVAKKNRVELLESVKKPNAEQLTYIEKLGFTPEQLTATAASYGMTEQQVILDLKTRYKGVDNAE